MGNSRVCIYARVSTSDGKQNYDRQINDLKKFIINQHNYSEEQIDIYPEMVSGFKNEDQVQLNKILEIVKVNPSYYKSVYVTEVSRIGRNPKHTRKVLNELTEANVNIYIQQVNGFYVNEDGSKNYWMNMIVDIMINQADFEVEVLRNRIKSGILNGIRGGRAGGGTNYPYGFMKSLEGLLIVNEDEAAIIREIFTLYSQGLGTKSISNILNSKNIPTRFNKLYKDKIMRYWVGKRGLKENRPSNYKHTIELKKGSDVRWSDGQIWSILTNPIYIGKRKFKGELYDCPRIIEDDLYTTCQTLRKNKTTRLSPKYVFLLGDLIKCGICNKNYVGRFKEGPRGEKVYKCMSTRYLGGSCGNRGINITLVESVLFHLIGKSSNLIDLVNFSSEMTENLQAEIGKNSLTLKEKQYELSEEQNVPDKLLELYEKSLISIEVFETRYNNSHLKINRLEKDIKRLSKEIKSKLDFLNSPENSRLNVLKDSISDREKIKEYFRLFFDKIKVKFVHDNYILLEVYVKLINGNQIKFVLSVDRTGIKTKPKLYRYRIDECVLIAEGKGYTIINSKYGEGNEINNIGLEVGKLLTFLKKGITEADNLKEVVLNDIISKKIITISDEEIIPFY